MLLGSALQRQSLNGRFEGYSVANHFVTGEMESRLSCFFHLCEEAATNRNEWQDWQEGQILSFASRDLHRIEVSLPSGYWPIEKRIAEFNNRDTGAAHSGVRAWSAQTHSGPRLSISR
jgi:hypothetical protein